MESYIHYDRNPEMLENNDQKLDGLLKECFESIAYYTNNNTSNLRVNSNQLFIKERVGEIQEENKGLTKDIQQVEYNLIECSLLALVKVMGRAQHHADLQSDTQRGKYCDSC